MAKATLSINKIIANTLTQVIGFTMPANTLAAGTLIEFTAIGLLTNTTASTSILTLRINSATLGAALEASWSVALGGTARTNCPFTVHGFISIYTAGATGTALGCIVINVNTATALVAPTTAVTVPAVVNTTQSNIVELTCISGSTTTTWNFISAQAEVLTT
jgi:hypothetical protein